jgi:ABC-type multidrug transport system fused ATPase/permease subunit
VAPARGVGSSGGGEGLLAQQGKVSVGAVAAVALALRRLFGPLDSLAWLYSQAVAARARLARVLDLADPELQPDLTGPPAGEPAGLAPCGEPGALLVDSVTFSYGGGPPVLAGASLRVALGEHVAIVGPSGAGKSTLAKLVAGLLEPQVGCLSVDGRPVTASPGGRRPVVLIPQEGHVSAGTLADNLRLVPGDHSDKDLARAIEVAGLDGWVASLPGGLDAELADRGANLSAGERQLVALPRAALADPEVLVLDEATADIDPVTEATVTAALARLGKGRTPVGGGPPPGDRGPVPTCRHRGWRAAHRRPPVLGLPKPCC